MYKEIWHKIAQSVAQLNFYLDSDIKIMTLSGFKVRNFLVTDASIRKVGPFDKVEIKFVKKDGCTPLASKTISKYQLDKRTIMGLNDKVLNFVFIKIDFEEFSSIPSLALSDETGFEIGQLTATLGYQLNQENLALKRGMISSLCSCEGHQYIQVDTSIKVGNAGGPLINVETGKVIGIIGSKLTEISKSYRNLKEIMNKNIKLLNQYQGKYNFEDIDPFQVLIANQNQIKYIIKEIYKIADAGVGYAISAQLIRNFIKENIILEESTSSGKELTGF
jgi:hypothetical protein